MKVICVTGMPGSGKSLVSKVASEMGVKVFVMGDVVREEALKRGIPINPENLRALAMRLREEEGADAVAKRVVAKVKRLGDGVVVIDGVRSLAEVECFKKHLGEVTLICVHASPKTRFKRLLRRGRPDDPKSWEEFVKRDLMELKLGLGEVIALSDFMIVNEGPMEDTLRAIKKVLHEVVSSK